MTTVNTSTPPATTPTNTAAAGAGTTSNPNSPGVITDQGSLDSTFSDFLTLLTTQLQNQDPTSPMDTAQFTSQLVSFSQVEQQLKSNADLDKLVTASTNNQTQLGLSYIGLDVSMTGNQFKFDPSKISTVGISYNLASTSASTNINILDSNGNVVFSTNGSTTAGDNTFEWNGTENDGSTAPAGSYTVQVGALDGSNNAVAVTTQVPGQVTGMQTASDGTVELVIDNAQAVPLSSVTSAWVPGSNTTASNSSSTGSGS